MRRRKSLFRGDKKIVCYKPLIASGMEDLITRLKKFPNKKFTNPELTHNVGVTGTRVASERMFEYFGDYLYSNIWKVVTLSINELSWPTEDIPEGDRLPLIVLFFIDGILVYLTWWRVTKSSLLDRVNIRDKSRTMNIRALLDKLRELYDSIYYRLLSKQWRQLGGLNFFDIPKVDRTKDEEVVLLLCCFWKPKR